MASVADVVGSALSGRQIELEEVTQTKAGSRVVLGVTIDGDGSSGRGLSLDDVAEASRVISQALDDTDVMGEAAYVLQVGTRGVDRPLTRPAHFRRNTGRLVKVKTAAGESSGRISQVSDEAVTFSDGVSMPFSQIIKAVVEVEMNRDDDADEERAWTST